MTGPEKNTRRKTTPVEVDVVSLKNRTSRRFSSKPASMKPGYALMFGLCMAVAWHFLHHAGEVYHLTPADPRFWFHMVLEGTISLYAALFYLIVCKLWQKFK